MGQTVSLDYLALYEYTLPKPTLKTAAEAKLSDHLDNQKHNMELVKILRIWPSSLDADFNTIQCENFKETQMQDGSWYYGSLKGELKHGVGVQVFENPQSEITHVYGTFKDDKLDGQGMIIYKDETYYLGQWSNGKCNGFGYYRTKNGDFYLGDWKDGQLTEGYYRNSNYEYYGQLNNGNLHGYGRCLYYDGAIVEGEWKNDQMDGFITHQFQNKDLYHGFCKFSLKHGMGILNLKSEEKIYAGNFWMDKYHGLGQLITTKTEQGQPARIIQNGFFQYGELQQMYQEYNDKEKKLDWRLIKPNEQQEGDKILKVENKGTFCSQLGQGELDFEEIFKKRKETSEEIEKIIKRFNSNKDKYIKLEARLDLSSELLQLQKWFYAFDSKNLPKHFQNKWNDWIDQEKLHH